MRTWTRRLLWILFYITSLIGVALVAGYIGRNFTGMGPIPTRSAFATRLPSTPDGDHRRFQFFYATNRANNDETFSGRGSTLGNGMLYGTYQMRISPYLPIEPWAWFNKKNMKIVARDELTQDEFKSQLRNAVQTSPHKSLLVIVWGFRDWFESAALKTGYTAYALDINTPVLLFDWPGNQGEGRSGYIASQQVALQSAPDLGRLLANAIRETGAENLWLMGSSLGCQTICDALAWLKTQPDLLQGKKKISHVILSAPDVSANAFDKEFSDSIQALSLHLTAYVSSNDRALLMSHWLNGERRLGRKAEVMTPPDQRHSEYEFEEALELLHLQAAGTRIISVVDASPINTTRNLHHFFTDAPEFFDDLYQRLLQPDNIVSRRLYPVRLRRQNVFYWILWND